MANVPPDSLIFTPAAAYTEPRRRNFAALNGHLSAGASQDDALLISSDDESDDYLEDQSDTLPSIEELVLPARRKDGKSRSVADESFSATSSASGDSDAKESSVTDGADSDDETTSSWQQQTRGLERPPVPPSTLASLRPWFARPGPFQTKNDQLGELIPAGNSLCGTGPASDPQDTTCHQTAEGISHGFGAQHSHSLRLSGSPSPWSRLPQTDQDPPHGIGKAPREAGQIPYSDNATRDVLVQETLGATILGRVAEKSPSSSRETTPYLDSEAEQSPSPQREASLPRETTPCLDAESQSDDLSGQHVQSYHFYLRGANDKGVWPTKAIPESKRNRPRDAHSDDDLGQNSDDNSDSHADTDGDDTDGDDTDGDDSNGDDADGDDDYRPPSLEGSTGELDEEHDFGPPPSKRRKTVSAIPATPKTAATPRLRSSGPVSQERNVQSPGRGRKRSRRSIPSPPFSSASHDGKRAVGAVFARFEEWPLQNVSLKRVTEKGMTTFQLQFSWDSCEYATETPRSESPVNKRNSTKRGATPRAAITPDEDDLVIKLKEVDRLRWKEIHKKFTEAFPARKRSVATLQVRYCTKLKQRIVRRETGTSRAGPTVPAVGLLRLVNDRVSMSAGRKQCRG